MDDCNITEHLIKLGERQKERERERERERKRETEEERERERQRKREIEIERALAHLVLASGFWLFYSSKKISN